MNTIMKKNSAMTLTSSDAELEEEALGADQAVGERAGALPRVDRAPMPSRR